MSGTGKRAEATPVIVLNDTRVDQHHGCSRVMSALESLTTLNKMRIVHTRPAHCDWRGNPGFESAIAKARLVIVNGEGTFHHSRPSAVRLLEVGAYARRLNIPAVLINTLWQENDQRCVALLKDFALVSARDSLSASQIQMTGVSCRVVPDLSLYGPRSEAPVSRSGVGFTDSALRSATLGLERARRRAHGAVVPIQFSGPGILGAYRFHRAYIGKQDLAHPVDLYRILRLRVAQYRTQTAETDAFITRLKGLELLVSGRFHACTMAMIARTPFVTTDSNSHKIDALIADAGLAPWRARHGLERDQIEEARRVGWGSGELSAVNDYVDEGRRSAEALFRDVAALI